MDLSLFVPIGTRVAASNGNHLSGDLFEGLVLEFHDSRAALAHRIVKASLSWWRPSLVPVTLQVVLLGCSNKLSNHPRDGERALAVELYSSCQQFDELSFANISAFSPSLIYFLVSAHTDTET